MHFIIHVESGTQIILGYLTVVLLSLICAYFFIRPLVVVGEYAKSRPWNSFFIGLVSCTLLAALTLLLAVSPLKLFLLSWYGFVAIVSLYGLTATGLLLGEACLKIISYKEHPLAETICGVSFLFLLAFVPYVGIGLVALLLLITSGAAVKLKGGFF